MVIDAASTMSGPDLAGLISLRTAVPWATWRASVAAHQTRMRDVPGLRVAMGPAG
jgi:hypothetical protein